MSNKWIDVDAWRFEKAWRAWRECTFHLPSDSKEARAHPLYKEVERLQKEKK